MPDKPTWIGRLDEVIAKLESIPYPWVDRPTLEHLLGIGRRRAQQILKPCVLHRVGTNGVADRSLLIEHLRRVAAGETTFYERQRRRKLAAELERCRRALLTQPRVLVEAPEEIVKQDFAGLPAGITLGPGHIHIDFHGSDQALGKLLALAMAIGNEPDLFERITQTKK